ncbi:hypothetical protein XENTR_v10022550 [Xenopus tropicalis]|nr:hypothetical protein XENTR_v10022550 [Xenopus tropicalis]
MGRPHIQANMICRTVGVVTFNSIHFLFLGLFPLVFFFFVYCPTQKKGQLIRSPTVGYEQVWVTGNISSRLTPYLLTGQGLR